MLVSLRSQSVKLIAHLKSSTKESVIIVRYLALKKIFSQQRGIKLPHNFGR